MMRIPLGPKQLACLFLCAALQFCLAGYSAAEEKSSPLAHYIAEAMAHNEDILAARAELQAQAERVRQHGVLPDPKLAVHYYIEPVETRTGPQEAAISLSQGLPWFGKLSLAREEEKQGVGMAAARLAAVELRVVRLLKAAYIHYSFNLEAQKIAGENLELLRYLESVAYSRYSGGKLDFASVLRIQMQVARSQESLASLQDQAQPLRAALNTLMGADHGLKRGEIQGLIEVELPNPDLDFQALARAKSPELRAAQAQVKRERVGLKRAHREFYPDLALSLKTILTGPAEFGDPPDSGNDPIIAGLTLNIPLFQDRRQGAVAEQEAAIRSSRLTLQSRERALALALENALYGYRQAQRQAQLYNTELIPKVRQELEVVLKGFENGQATVKDLIEAQQDLLDFGLKSRKAVADQAVMVARLEELVGLTLAPWTE
ncbi:MAG: TolC family protein [Thermodesulfobacteriota bacterium]